MADYTAQFHKAIEDDDMDLARRLMVEHGDKIGAKPRPYIDTDERTTVRSVVLSVRAKRSDLYRIDHDDLDGILVAASERFGRFVKGEIPFLTVERFAP